jgi:chromosome partitioning protein
MGKIVAVANQKGGVGKTTTTVNLAAAVAASGKKVLLLDADPQGNATSGVGVNKKAVDATTYEVLLGTKRIDEAVQHTPFKNLDVLPATIDLAAAELELGEMESRAQRLRQVLISIRDRYDYMFIDCPPSLGLITLNALVASDSVLIPIQCEYYALEGLSQLIATVRQVRRLYNDTIEVEGVLLTMYDGRLNLTVQVADEVKKFFPQKVYATAIPRNVRLSEAPSYGQPILYYDRTSKGAQAYEDLAKEFLRKNR